MSSSEENFNLDVSDVSESDDYAPVVKKIPRTKATARSTSTRTKGTVRAKAAKKNVLSDKNDNVDNSEDDEPVSAVAGPSTSNDEPTAANANAKKKTASETYTKVCRTLDLHTLSGGA